MSNAGTGRGVAGWLVGLFVLLAALAGAALGWRWGHGSGYEKGHRIGKDEGTKEGHAAGSREGYATGLRDGSSWPGRQMPIDTGTTYRSGSGLHVGTKHVHHALSQSDGAGAIAALGRAGFYEGHGGSPRDRIVRKLTLGSDIPAMVAADPRLRSYDHIGDVSCQGKVLHIKIPDGEAQLALGSEQDCADAKTAIDYEGWARQSTACDLGISAMEETKDFRVHVILPEGQSMHQCDNPPNENCHPWCESRPSE